MRFHFFTCGEESSNLWGDIDKLPQIRYNLWITLGRTDFMPKTSLDKKYVISKSNTLNEFRPQNMTLQELRLFTIYLSKINPKDESTRLVRFPLEDFQKIMNISSRAKISYYKETVRGILGKIADIDLPNGGFKMFQFFKTGELNQDEHGEWYIEIDATDEALPYMFNLKGYYFKYELWNALRLKSLNQLRLYEILKQYEKVGYRIISLQELKFMLGMNEGEYPQFRDFKRDVLNVCQEALSHYTDISFLYEPYGKKGRGGKVINLKFTITTNQTFDDPLSLTKFIETTALLTGDTDTEIESEDVFDKRISFLMEACDGEFTREQMEFINSLIMEKMPHIFTKELKCYEYLLKKCRYMNIYDRKVGIKNRFKYLCSIIGVIDDYPQSD